MSISSECFHEFLSFFMPDGFFTTVKIFLCFDLDDVFIWRFCVMEDIYL